MEFYLGYFFVLYNLYIVLVRVHRFFGRLRLNASLFQLQENHKYHIRIFAKNEVGVSEPLETEEPYTVQKPMGKPHVFIIIIIIIIFIGQSVFRRGREQQTLRNLCFIVGEFHSFKTAIHL